jgi:hypothetical protein
MPYLSREQSKNINSFLSRMRSPVRIKSSPTRKEANKINPNQKVLRDIFSTDYNKVPLNLTEQGFYLCQLKINNKKGVFLLDTGSNSTCVDMKLKTTFNMYNCEETDAVSVTDTIKILTTKDNIVEIGNKRKSNIKLDLVDLTHIRNSVRDEKVKDISGILGNRLLHEFKCLIDYSKNLLYIKK